MFLLCRKAKKKSGPRSHLEPLDATSFWAVRIAPILRTAGAIAMATVAIDGLVTAQYPGVERLVQSAAPEQAVT